jgi:hypothetical protein
MDFDLTFGHSSCTAEVNWRYLGIVRAFYVDLHEWHDCSHPLAFQRYPSNRMMLCVLGGELREACFIYNPLTRS